jgi:DNA-binding NarL/FixJ family response regulator
VLLVVPDLFFAARIREVAAAIGATVTEATAAAAADRAKDAALAIVDLSDGAAADTVRALRQAAPHLQIVGFHPHVDVEARDAALAAGADQVLPRSAFTRRLAELLAGA